MLPAISSEDCLYADLGVDPATTGNASYDATDFLLRNPLKVCTTFMGQDTCVKDNLPSEKVIALTAAAMF